MDDESLTKLLDLAAAGDVDAARSMLVLAITGRSRGQRRADFAGRDGLALLMAAS